MDDLGLNANSLLQIAGRTAGQDDTAARSAEATHYAFCPVVVLFCRRFTGMSRQEVRPSLGKFVTMGLDENMLYSSVGRAVMLLGLQF